MNKWDCKSAKVGENLPDLIVGPISRTNLSLLRLNLFNNSEERSEKCFCICFEVPAKKA